MIPKSNKLSEFYKDKRVSLKLRVGIFLFEKVLKQFYMPNWRLHNLTYIPLRFIKRKIYQAYHNTEVVRVLAKAYTRLIRTQNRHTKTFVKKTKTHKLVVRPTFKLK